ncbi:Galactokinase [Balamuthia mandrillaris]
MQTDFPPVCRELKQIYDFEKEELEAVHARYSALENAFRDRYDGRAPHFFARAPGRVNLIGEHIDYSGYGVLPMALDKHDTILAIAAAVPSPQEEGKVNLANMDEERFAARSGLPFATARPDPSRHDWSNYFLAGCRGVIENQQEEEGEKAKLDLSLDIMVHGTVPIGSGLSSSSALVCASTLGITFAKDFISKGQQEAYAAAPVSIAKTRLADISCQCERYIGMESGGMDQAISFLAESGKAKKIDFDPLRSRNVALPKGVSFVIASSMVESNKYATAESGYNMRVVECRLAAVVLAKAIQMPEWKSVRRLIDLHRYYSSAAESSSSSAEILSLLMEKVQLHLEDRKYSLVEIAAFLQLELSELKELYLGSLQQWVHWNEEEEAEKESKKISPKQPTFELYKRALHVYSEAKRVDDFETLCQEINLRQQHEPQTEQKLLSDLGELMNQSHYSCRDLFDCSCPELDKLTQLCRESGAVGSRLTGAGWGGWTISLVPNERLEEFFAKVRAQFYGGVEEASMERCMLATRSGSGAAVYLPSYSQ